MITRTITNKMTPPAPPNPALLESLLTEKERENKISEPFRRSYFDKFIKLAFFESQDKYVF